MELENVVLCIAGENDGVVTELKKQIYENLGIRNTSVSDYLRFILKNDGVENPTPQQLSQKAKQMCEKKLAIEIVKYSGCKTVHSYVFSGVSFNLYKIIKCLMSPLPCILIYVESDGTTEPNTVKESSDIVIGEDIDIQSLVDKIKFALNNKE